MAEVFFTGRINNKGVWKYVGDNRMLLESVPMCKQKLVRPCPEPNWEPVPYPPPLGRCSRLGPYAPDNNFYYATTKDYYDSLMIRKTRKGKKTGPKRRPAEQQPDPEPEPPAQQQHDPE